MKRENRIILSVVLLSAVAVSSLFAQRLQPPPSGGGYDSGYGAGAGGGGFTPVIEEPPPEVLIEGIPASQLTDEQWKEWLQEKIKTIYQGDGQVQILRVAPGFPLTITFDEPAERIIVGDPSLFNITAYPPDTPKSLTIKPNKRPTNPSETLNTSMQVFFPGDKLRMYHIFVTENYLNADAVIRVVSFKPGAGGVAGGLGMTGSGNLNIRAITQIIRNYDALEQERAIDNQSVKRFEVFRKSKVTSFTTFYLYQFAEGPLAISFAYQNPYPYPIRYDESRLRIALGNMRYLPDYVSFHKTTLSPGETTTGFAVVARPVFTLDQPFELVWK